MADFITAESLRGLLHSDRADRHFCGIPRKANLDPN